MKKVTVDAYKLDRIISRMAREFGTIPEGEEELYVNTLFAMEGNLLKLHRKDSRRTGRHALEALQMTLLTIDGYLREIEYDFTRVITPENQALMEGLQMSFDPYTNADIRGTIMENSFSFEPIEYFDIPIKCLLRIEKSIRLWTKHLGSNGYFIFMEGQMGELVKRDEKMTFAVLIKKI